VRPVRSLLSALVRLPWQATHEHPVLAALRLLRDLYDRDRRQHLGRLLRTVFLSDYFLNDVFRRELLRVRNRGEAVAQMQQVLDHWAQRPSAVVPPD
jgi:Tn3 transposase DDE domain-containing protein